MSLVISDLSKSRHGTSLLNGVNLELRSGAIHGLFGRNGAGKSTLLNIIANRLVADAGSVSFDGNRMTDGGGMWERLMLMDETLAISCRMASAIGVPSDLAAIRRIR